jgi:hypothetical protein
MNESTFKLLGGAHAQHISIFQELLLVLFKPYSLLDLSYRLSLLARFIADH